MKQDYDIDLSGYYQLSNQERLKLLSRKRAINPSIYQPPEFNSKSSNQSTIESRNNSYNTIAHNAEQNKKSNVSSYQGAGSRMNVLRQSRNKDNRSMSKDGLQSVAMSIMRVYD